MEGTAQDVELRDQLRNYAEIQRLFRNLSTDTTMHTDRYFSKFH